MAWRVLGFGGKPNPLVYSRLASFLMRTAQALVGSPTHRRQYGDKMAMCRGQLYVDDPIWTLRGSPEQCAASADVILMWWLALGVPLSW